VSASPPTTPVLPPRFDNLARQVADVLGIAAGLVVLISGVAVALLGDGRFMATAAFLGVFLGLAAGVAYRLSIGASLAQLESFLAAFQAGRGGAPP
jgi:hypothetical protein